MDTPRTGKTKKKIVSKVIKFPLHKVRKPKTDLATQQSKEKAKEISENIFIEQLVEEFTLDFIHVLQENAVVMKNESFLRDLAVVIESIKSLLKRDFKKKHPLQTITDAIAKISTLPNGKQVTDMNYNKVFVTKPKVDK
tara:strand:- start:380 stop:796 length:417 start_codon:yes stop_codon:yes gene_type:complete